MVATRTAGPRTARPAAPPASPRAVPPPPPPPRSPLTGPRARAAAVTVPAATAAALGGWRIGVPDLWADELATWQAARLPGPALDDLLGTVDAVFGPYYRLVHAWTAVAGDSATALRLPSLLAVVTATALVAALGVRVAGAAAGLVAGLLFAAVPAVSRYAQEARPYAFVLAGAAGATLLLLRLLDRPGRGAAAGYAVAVTATGLAHPLGGLLLAAGHGVGVVLARARPWPWLGAAAVGVAPVLVLLLGAAGQAGQVAWIREVTWRSLVLLPEQLAGGAVPGGVLLALALAGAAGRGAARRDRVVLAAAAAVPPLALFTLGTVQPVWVARYLLAVLPPAAVLAAAGLGRVPAPHRLLVLALTAAGGWPAQLAVRAPDGHGQASAAVAAIVGPWVRPGDVLVVPDWHPSIPWAARDVVQRYLPAPLRPPDVLARAPQRTGGRLLADECPDAACLGTPPRIWVVRTDHSADPLRDMAYGKAQRLLTGYRTAARWDEPLLTVFLLVRRTADTPPPGPAPPGGR